MLLGQAFDLGHLHNLCVRPISDYQIVADVLRYIAPNNGFTRRPREACILKEVLKSLHSAVVDCILRLTEQAVRVDADT